ncbi:MAG: nucleoside phosphorylase [Clostridiales bacterium]|nr:nucleoside phosphorylase [Clostridiales bacterium]
MLHKEFPILEFDSDKDAFIRLSHTVAAVEVSEHCVLCFFGEAIAKILLECPHKVVGEFRAGSIRLPIYELAYKGAKVVLIEAFMGAPGAAGQIEELTALGCRKFIACGACGVLDHDIAVGHLIIPTAAVRDEGTSYHYIAPAREIVANVHIVQVIEETLSAKGLPYIKAKTWTTDAFYRETPAKIQLRKAEDCVAVEMEAAAYMAVAQYNDVEFGQILYAGDNLGGAVWDSRNYNGRTEVRELVLRASLDACLRL